MYQIYQIIYGDSLENIANKFNTTIDSLKKINRDISLVPGSYMIVPYNDEEFSTYIIQNGDSLYAIANNYGISVDALASINGLKKNDYIYPNQEIIVPTGNTKIYITKENDTLQDIAKSMNTNYSEIIQANENIYLIPDQMVILKKEKN